MKLVLDEKIKHRLIGLAVILSIAAIFAPAVVKKSNQRLQNNMNISMQLPPKPGAPQVNVPDENAMFNKVQPATAEVPKMPDEHIVMKVAKAEQLSLTEEVKLPSRLVELKINVPNHIATPKAVVTSEPKVKKTLASNQVTPPKVIKKAKLIVTNKPLINKAKKPLPPVAKATNHYAVQLATFSQRQNAESLIEKLRQKGFKANYTPVKTAEGTLYRVVVGNTNQKIHAQILQKQLASVMQLKGFIIDTGVS